MTLSVNGHQYQNGNSRTMVFGVARLVSYISRYMTLAPGDVISTGHSCRSRPWPKPAGISAPGDVDWTCKLNDSAASVSG